MFTLSNPRIIELTTHQLVTGSNESLETDQIVSSTDGRGKYSIVIVVVVHV